MKKLLYIGYSMLILSTIILVYLLFIITYPFKIVTLDESPIRVINHTVCAGDDLRFILKFTKHMNIKPYAQYFLVDKKIILLSDENINRSVGKQEHELHIGIPNDTPDDTYILRIELQYFVNRFRSINYSWDSERFDVKQCTTNKL